eukprot:CAMPEP_0201491640 /NCGR_PEP_ID=MMETSP0151_2-20130828/30617_1 /ASSEMBLY_ACC=CAM_ASM_000257 /TAXON_ID=200890 /ORGANISM="Paramoeba atlantica, Strain 621/1 / CCAP 1560/9" /LENGTH=72 /DNA_ID=CAMNT_0047878095 /DNA_START=297 /DNA_END=512 /DNA_ORIENTATION=-
MFLDAKELNRLGLENLMISIPLKDISFVEHARFLFTLQKRNLKVGADGQLLINAFEEVSRQRSIRVWGDSEW